MKYYRHKKTGILVCRPENSTMISSWEPKDYTELINYDPLSIEAPPEELAEELAKIAELEKQALELEALLTEGAPSHDL